MRCRRMHRAAAHPCPTARNHCQPHLRERPHPHQRKALPQGPGGVPHVVRAQGLQLGPHLAALCREQRPMWHRRTCLCCWCAGVVLGPSPRYSTPHAHGALLRHRRRSYISLSPACMQVMRCTHIPLSSLHSLDASHSPTHRGCPRLLLWAGPVPQSVRVGKKTSKHEASAAERTHTI